MIKKMQYLEFSTQADAQSFCDKMWNKIKGTIPKDDTETKKYDTPFEEGGKWYVHVPNKFDKYYDASDKAKFKDTL